MKNNQKMKKCGVISLIGETNSGKSTLVNNLVGAKVSIISHKVQTTRNKIWGVFTEGDDQVIFIDTPGIFNPSREFDKQMVKEAYSSLSVADSLCLVVDSNKGVTNTLQKVLEKIKPINTQKILLLNKIDLIEKTKLLKLVTDIDNIVKFNKVFFISALKNDGIQEFIQYIRQNIPEREWEFDGDEVSNVQLSFMATEITREKIYKYLNQELPYMIIVKQELWKETEGAATIKQVIYVTSQSHKKMVIGSNGSNIKRIGISAKKELEDILEKKVHLYLHVKIEKDLFSKEHNLTLKESNDM